MPDKMSDADRVYDIGLTVIVLLNQNGQVGAQADGHAIARPKARNIPSAYRLPPWLSRPQYFLRSVRRAVFLVDIYRSL